MTLLRQPFGDLLGDNDCVSVSSWGPLYLSSNSATLGDTADYDDLVSVASNASANTRVDFETERPAKGSLSDFFFGFMYEEENHGDLDEYVESSSSSSSASAPFCNPLSAALFTSLVLSSAASAVPVTLLSAMSQYLIDSNSNSNSNTTSNSDNSTNNNSQMTTTVSSLAPHITAAAVLGSSLGKFINGPVSDLFGARRTSVVYNLFLAVALLNLALCTNTAAAARACFFVEFTYSVQWPCIVITLAAHYKKNNNSSAAASSHCNNNNNNNNTNGLYENGIFVTSLAARLGSLLSILTCSLLLGRWYWPWRLVATVGAWMAAVASSITYFYVSDSATRVNEPQNPIDMQQIRTKWFNNNNNNSKNSARRHRLAQMAGVARWVWQTNVWPSVQHVGRSGTFWIVAMAHSGSCLVRTSGRLFATYLYETSYPTVVSYSHASLWAVFGSVGMVLGLLTAGRAFVAGNNTARQRKWLVWRLYCASIGACYVLAFFGIPAVRRMFHDVPELVCIMQVTAITVAGFGVAVQTYHIPSLVGATFGRDKGLYSAYTDGVGYGLASIVWGIVGDSVHDDTNASGWAYGWAAVALLLILSAILMVEFMEHYFCRRQGSGGDYETIMFA
jgi:MFS family permease